VSAPGPPPGGGDTVTPATRLEPGQSGPERPKELDVSVWLWLAAIAIGLAAAVVETLLLRFSTLAPAIREVGQAGKPVDMNQLRQSFPVIKGIAVGVAVLAHAVWLLFVLKCRSGRHWARTVLAVAGVLWLIYTLVSAPQLPTGQLPALAQTLAVISAGYYMFHPASNKYFAALHPPPGGPPSGPPR
jgi:hypothetical protein